MKPGDVLRPGIGVEAKPTTARNAIFFTYVANHTIIYKSTKCGRRWTSDMENILEIIEGELPENDIIKVCKKYALQ